MGCRYFPTPLPNDMHRTSSRSIAPWAKERPNPSEYRHVDATEAMEVIQLGSFDLLGSVVNVRSSAPLAPPLTAALTTLSCRPTRRAPLLTVERFADGDWSVSWRDEQRYRGPDEGVAFYDVLGAFNDAAARHVASNGRVGLHGGAVDIDGRAIAMVGHSGSGKSTLTAALVQAGHGYIADEVTAVTAVTESGGDQLTVSPFHRPIGLRSDGARILGIDIPAGPFEHTFPLDATSIGRLGGPAPLQVIAFVERDPGAEPTIEPISPAATLHRLSNQTLGTWGLERQTFRRLETMVNRVDAIVMRYDSVADGVALVERAMSKHD